MSGQCVTSGIKFVRGERVFAGNELGDVLKALEGAAGILPRKGDKRGEVRAWKMACAMNHDKVRAVAIALGERLRDIISPWPAWGAAAAKLDALAERVLGAFIPADQLVFLLLDPNDDTEAALSVRHAHGEDAVKRLLAALVEWWNVEPFEVRDACKARIATLKQASDVVYAPVTVHDLCLVSWAALPCALHGGYLRDLAWMFTHVSPDAAELVAASTCTEAKGVDGAS